MLQSSFTTLHCRFANLPFNIPINTVASGSLTTSSPNSGRIDPARNVAAVHKEARERRTGANMSVQSAQFREVLSGTMNNAQRHCFPTISARKGRRGAVPRKIHAPFDGTPRVTIT